MGSGGDVCLGANCEERASHIQTMTPDFKSCIFVNFLDEYCALVSKERITTDTLFVAVVVVEKLSDTSHP